MLVGACKSPYKEPDVPEAAEYNKIKVRTESFSPGDVHFYWTAHDSLAVYTSAHTTAELFKLTAGVANTEAHFSGKTTGSPLYALYPYSNRSGDPFNGSELSLYFPSAQTYSANGPGPDSVPMLAVGEGTDLTAYNLCGLIQLPLKGNANINSIFLKTKGNEPLSGKIRVNTAFTGASEPQLSSNGGEIVFLTCPGVALKENEPTPFYLAVPPGTYRGGFTIEVVTFTETAVFEWAQDVTVERSKVISTPTYTCESEEATDPDNLPSNQIWYKTVDGLPAPVGNGTVNARVVSNVYDDDGWGKIVFDGPVRLIYKEGFSYFRLTDIRLPNGVEVIGEKAFYANPFTDFRTPDSLIQVDQNAFAACSHLTRFYGKWASADESSIILSDGKLVAYATGLINGSVTIPEGAISLADYLFFRDLNIQEVILPEGLEKIGEFAFQLQPLLERVVFSSTVTTVGRHAFEYCPNLSSFEGTNAMIRDGRSLVDSDGWLLAVAGKGITDYVAPADANKLFSGAFVGMYHLKSITFSIPLENFYSDAISDCPNLEFFYGPGTTEDHHGIVFEGDYLVKTTPILPEEYTVPDSIHRIFWSVFEDNTTTRKLVIPDAVYSIGHYCFSGMRQLETLQLPASLKEVGGQAFRKCDKLQHLYLRSYAPPLYPKDDDNSYFGHSGLTIHVPFGSETDYNNAAGWRDYSSYIHGYGYKDLPEREIYHSTDFSQDGKVNTLQKATEGQGINLVLMGDAFSDRQFSNDIYGHVMQQMADAFLSEEPYASYRHLFNVYSVNVVSATEGYAEAGGQALETRFVGGTEVEGNDRTCLDYALKAVSEADLDNTVIIVAMNSTTYGGTCKMFTSVTGEGDGAGTGIAYVPLGPNESIFAQVVRHEAAGHAFAKLADEYANVEGSIPASEKGKYLDRMPLGWFKNVDFTGDRTAVKWARFLQDARYANEPLGCYEGGLNYTQGVWRPSSVSIMNNNDDGFNAPSREAIWIRIHRLAFGSSWEYSFEAFAEYDTRNLATKSPKPRGEILPSLPAPTLIPYSWSVLYSQKSLLTLRD